MQGAKIGKAYPVLPSKKDDIAVITAIVAEFTNRSKQNMQTWRQGLESADDPENPRWVGLQDLYEYLSADGHLESQIALRKGAVLGKRFFVRDSGTGKEDKDKTKMLQKAWFFNLMGDLLDSIPRGYTVVQFPDPKVVKDYSLNPLVSPYLEVPRRNFIPQMNAVLFEATGDKGVFITDPAFKGTFVCMKNQRKFGLMNYIVPDLIFKKNARIAWAEFGDRFGIPLVTINTNKTDKKDLDRIETMAKLMGKAGRAILPDGSKMEIIDTAAKGDPFKIYQEQINLGNDEISKLFVGGTMISQDGSSRSQSEVHEKQLEKLTAMDFTNLEFVINDQLFPILLAGGFGISPKDEFAFDRSQNLTLKEHWDIVSGILERGYELEDQWIMETFNVPVTGRKQPVTANFNKPSEAPKAALEGVSFPEYRTIQCCLPKDQFKAAGDRDSAFRKLMDGLQEQLLQNVFEGKDSFNEQVQKSIAVGSEYREALFDGWGQRRMEIAYGATDHRALALMEQNIFTFTTLREKASVLELNRLLLDKEGNKLREFNDFKKQALPHLQNMNLNWLKTEYDFAVAAGQNGSTYHQFLSEADTVTRLVQYLTVGDARVREKHRLLNGKVFSIDDPEARKLWPPNDWNCRCEMIQFLGRPENVLSGQEGMELIDWNEKQAKIFAVNRGDIGQVFTQNQWYAKSMGLAGDVRRMTFETYGLKAWEDMRDQLPEINLDATITPANVEELWKPVQDENYMGFEDHMKRKLILKRDVFDEHTSDKYTSDSERRHQIFGKLGDILRNPDEVYLFDYKKDTYQMRYVKFYQDKVIVVPATVGTQHLEVMTWYEMKVKEKAVRNGLLIHKKSKP